MEGQVVKLEVLDEREALQRFVGNLEDNPQKLESLSSCSVLSSEKLKTRQKIQKN